MLKTMENMTKKELLEKAHIQQILLESLEATKVQLKKQNNNLEKQTIRMESQINHMQFQIDQMQRLLFGAKRERFVKNHDENQLTLPFDVEQVEEPKKEVEEITYKREKKKRENHHGRLALPAHLPVEEIVIEPEEDTTDMKCIGKEVTDQLELVPAKLYIKRYIRPKYITSEDEKLNHKGIIAQLPTFPIEKGIAGPGSMSLS